MKPDMIHVGLHKTGSTFFQQEVFPRVDKYIVSDEGFCGHPYKDQVLNDGCKREVLIHGLQDVFGSDMKIFLGLREPVGWKQSLYNQYVKEGGFKSFDAWDSDLFTKGYDDMKYLESLVCDCFDDVFVYWFDEFVTDKNHLIHRFCPWLGVPMVDFDDIRYNSSWGSYKLVTGRLRSYCWFGSRRILEWLP